MGAINQDSFAMSAPEVLNSDVQCILAHSPVSNQTGNLAFETIQFIRNLAKFF